MSWGRVCMSLVLPLEGPGREGKAEAWRQEEPACWNGRLGHRWASSDRSVGRLSLVVSPSQARISHRFTFSDQGCPQSVQSRGKQTSRREEGAPLRPCWGLAEAPCLELVSGPGGRVEEAACGSLPGPQPTPSSGCLCCFLTLLVTVVHQVNLFCVTIVFKGPSHTTALGC